MQPTILIVDDDEDVLQFLKTLFKENGYRVLAADNASDGMSLAKETMPDLIMLDIHLPGISGWEMLKIVRSDIKTRGILVVLMSGRSVEPADIVRGLREGADDYVPKPVKAEVLCARVKAMLRRKAWSQPGQENVPQTERVEILKTVDDTLEVNQSNRTVIVCTVIRKEKYPSNIDLTRKEFDLLCYFLNHRGAVLDRQALLASVWGMEAEVYTRTVDKHVETLRKKLGPAGKFIQTVSGVGYKFAED